jgi:hypothetical protein
MALSGNKVFVATDRGLWRSADGGNSYQNVGLRTNESGTGVSTLPYGNIVTEVVVHPDNANIVTAVVGSARGKVNSTGNGFYRSTNGGAPGSFTKMSPTGLDAGSLTDDPIGRTSLAYATGPGQDHNVMWALVQDAGLQNYTLKGGVALPTPPPSLLNGIYRSADNGATWTLKGSWQTLLAAPGSAMAPIAALGSGPGVQAWYNNWIVVSPADEDIVLVGLEEVYQTSANATGPGPATWKTIGRYWNNCVWVTFTPCDQVDLEQYPYAGSSTHPDQHFAALTPDGQRLFVANDGGVYAQTATPEGFSNTRWESLNATIGTTQPYYTTVARDNTVYAGFQDNGTTVIKPNRYAAMIWGGDGGAVQVDPNNSNRLWAETQNANIIYSTNGGRNWTSAAPAMTAPQFITPIVMDPKNVNHVVTAGREIMETVKGFETVCDDSACDWVELFDLGTNTEATPPVNYSVTALDVSGPVIYAGYCGTCRLGSADPTGDLKFDNGIATNRKRGCTAAAGSTECWHHARAKGLPNRFITDVAIDNKNPSVVYVTLAGFSTRWTPVTKRVKNAGRGHVFMSRDGGETFVDVSKNLPDIPAESIEVAGSRLFVGTHAGAYTAAKPGAAWERLGMGMPNAAVVDLVLHPDGKALIAATHGRGIWRYDVPSKQFSISASVTSDLGTSITGMSVAPAAQIAAPLSAGAGRGMPDSAAGAWAAMLAGGIGTLVSLRYRRARNHG